MSLSSGTDTSPSTMLIEYERYFVTLTFQVSYTSGQIIGTFDVPATFIRNGKIVNMSISPFYIGTTIPQGAHGLETTLPNSEFLFIRTINSSTNYIPRRCFNGITSILPFVTADIFFYSTDEVLDITNLKRGVFEIQSGQFSYDNQNDNGRLKLTTVFTFDGRYYSSNSSFFSCPYGIDAGWIVDNETR